MLIYKSDTRVFYSKDCNKYGVEKIQKAYVLHCKDGISRQLYKWSQIDPQPRIKNRSAYTSYKKVAERWAKNNSNGSIETRADMIKEYK